MPPLEGITVLDLSRYLPGLYCSFLLSGLGANVIHVEPPSEATDGIAKKQMPFVLNANKRSIVLNLKHKKGKEIFMRLVKDTDVILEHFRPGVTKRLGIDFNTLVRKINASLIYCSITGFGQEGPYRDKPGHDINYIGYAGILGLTGGANGPPVIPGIPIADLSSSMFAALAIMGALQERSKSGKPQHIDIAMLDGMVSWLTFLAASHFAGADINRGNMLLGGAEPYYGVYRTKDEKYLAVGAIERKFWENLCVKLGRKTFIPHQHNAGKKAQIALSFRNVFRKRDLEDWLKLLGDDCVSPVYSLEEVFNDPHVIKRNLVLELLHPVLAKPIKVLRNPIGYLGSEIVATKPGPLPGQDTAEILGELGYTSGDIKYFEKEGAVQSFPCNR
jgi:crotonobetainyl-CoA:carnitine CoA-transferase CaiB-like acyl-CoA transferase